jgi:hypothetical protein
MSMQQQSRPKVLSLLLFRVDIMIRARLLKCLLGEILCDTGFTISSETHNGVITVECLYLSLMCHDGSLLMTLVFALNDLGLFNERQASKSL